MRDGDRGQSELVGFVLIFGIVVLTVGLVTATGFAGVTNVQDYQRTTNVEGAFTALAGNVEEVVRGDAPSRATAIGITDASLSLEANSSGVDVAVDGEQLDLGGANRTGTIVYDSGSNTAITYRSGALLRRDGEDSVMFREPDFVITDEEVILPLTALSSDRASEIGGTSTVDVQARHEETTVVADGEPVADTVTITMGTPHVDAWTRYFEQFEGDGPVTDVTPEPDGNSVEVEIRTDRLSVVVDRVSVRFQ